MIKFLRAMELPDVYKADKYSDVALDFCEQ